MQSLTNEWVPAVIRVHIHSTVTTRSQMTITFVRVSCCAKLHRLYLLCLFFLRDRIGKRISYGVGASHPPVPTTFMMLTIACFFFRFAEASAGLRDRCKTLLGRFDPSASGTREGPLSFPRLGVVPSSTEEAKIHNICALIVRLNAGRCTMFLFFEIFTKINIDFFSWLRLWRRLASTSGRCNGPAPMFTIVTTSPIYC